MTTRDPDPPKETLEAGFRRGGPAHESLRVPVPPGFGGGGHPGGSWYVLASTASALACSCEVSRRLLSEPSSSATSARAPSAALASSCYRAGWRVSGCVASSTCQAT